jgi:hypothetical protein
MDRLAAHIVATAVLTVALAAIPTVMAQPASSSSAAPAPTQPSTSPSAPSASGPSASASPSAPLKPPAPHWDPPAAYRRHEAVPPYHCPDAFQVGPTEYARWHGAIAFSVRQFYSPSCHARFGYAHAWLQFRSMRVNYDVGLADFDVTHDAINGARTFVGGAGGPDFWSDEVAVPAGSCTEGLVHVFFPDDETDTFTDKFCV